MSIRCNNKECNNYNYKFKGNCLLTEPMGYRNIWQEKDILNCENYISSDISEYKNILEVVEALNEISSKKVTTQDYIDWLEGGKRYNYFDNIVKKYLGKKTHMKFDCLARLDAKLQYELGLGEQVVGGIDLKS